MARPPKAVDYDAHKAAIILYRKMSVNTSEDAIERLCLAIVATSEIAAIMSWPPVAKVHRQFKLGRAKADIVLEHEGGSITIIEVKAGSQTLREYCTGIGQLMYQSVMAASHFQTPHVRKVLALPGPVSVDLVFACAGGGVDILPTATAEQWDSFIDEATKNYHGRA